MRGIKFGSIFSHIRQLDLTLVFAPVLLTSIGLLSIYSLSLAKGDFFNFQKQAGFFIAGLLLMFGISFFDWRGLRTDSVFILFLYFICLLALVGLFLFAPEIRGTRSWYKIGPFSLDPIEPTKIVLTLLFAKYFSMRHIEMYRIHHIFLSGFYVAIPSILTFLRPDLGSVLILISIWVGILIVSGIKLRHFLLLCFLFLTFALIGWSFVLKDYQRGRIISFLNPQESYLGSGWNLAQSKIAIGSGGIFGKGLGKGSQVQYGFLPEPQTDFIFAAISEEMGLFGAAVILVLLFFLLWRISKIAFDAGNNFVRLFSIGLAILFGSQAFINIGMNLGLLPIVGLPLPFVSYGGSSLLVGYIGLGILQSMKVH